MTLILVNLLSRCLALEEKTNVTGMSKNNISIIKAGKDMVKSLYGF